MFIPFFGAVFSLFAALLGSTALASTGPTATYLSTPLAFETNRGQADPAVRYVARGQGYTMLLAPDAVVVGLRSNDAPAKHAVIRMRFVDGATDPALAGDAPLAARSHYLIGDDPS